jgi:double-stranded uracil-DNA glycosylase
MSSHPKATPLRPRREDLLVARRNKVPDVIAPGLKVLFCGINPGLYSAYTRHHFARPGNRFWPALFASGFTDRLLRPEDERELLQFGCGITNLADRATAAADELSREELVAGSRKLDRKLKKFRVATVAVLGVSAYRMAFQRPEAKLGAQPERLGSALVWVLPNPSGLNAHFTPPALAELFREFRLWVFRH